MSHCYYRQKSLNLCLYPRSFDEHFVSALLQPINKTQDSGRDPGEDCLYSRNYKPATFDQKLMKEVLWAQWGLPQDMLWQLQNKELLRPAPAAFMGPRNTYLPFVCGFYSDFFNPTKVTGWFWTLNGRLVGAAISDLGFHSRISEKAHLLQSSGFWMFHIFLGSPAFSLKINLIKMGFPLLGNDQITSPTLSQI